MFQSAFRFYKGYVIPVLKTTTDYLESIEKLSLIDTPEVF